jgi:hypothetical protein
MQWEGKTEFGIKRVSAGNRLILLHAGSENGFLEVMLVYKA